MSNTILEPIPQKQCTLCKQWKPATLEYFSACKRGKYGFRADCKECCNQSRRSRHQSRSQPPRFVLPEGMKMCAKCKQCKPSTHEYFYYDLSHKDGFCPHCRECQPRYEYVFVPDTYKKCKKCGQEKLATTDNFWVNRSRRGGLESRCIVCCIRRKPDTSVPPGYQRCFRCKEVKPATREFFDRNTNKYAVKLLQGTCRICRGKVNPAQPVCDIPGYKPCHKCLQNFPATLEYFPTAPENSSGLDSYCRPCKKQIDALHTRNRRARKKLVGGKHTLQDIQDQYKRQKGKCYYCHKPVAWGKYHVDHVIPLTRGGSDDPSNLVIACPGCNLKKHNKLPHEWPEGGRLL